MNYARFCLYLALFTGAVCSFAGCSQENGSPELSTVFSYENETFKLGTEVLELDPSNYNGLKLEKKKGVFSYELIQPENPEPAAETLNVKSLSCLYSFAGESADYVLGIVGTVDFRDVARSVSDGLEGAGYLLMELKSKGDSVLFRRKSDGVWEFLLYNEAAIDSCKAGCSSCAKDSADYNEACTGGACPDAEFVKDQVAVANQEEFVDLLNQYRKRRLAASPLCSHDGRIREVFMMDMVSANHPLDSVLSNFAGIFDALDPEVQYYVLINHDPKFTSIPEIRDSFSAKFHRLKSDSQRLVLIEPIDFCVLLEQGMQMELDTTFDCNTASLFSADYWAQDPITVLQTPGKIPVLMYPRQFNSFGDYFAASEISAQTGMLTRTAPFSFNAGNQLAGNGYMVMGADAKALALSSLIGSTIADSLTGFDALPDIDQLFKLVYGVDEIVWIGDATLQNPNDPNWTMEFGTYQPIYHIDMFLTLGGRVSATDSREMIFVGIPEVVNPHGFVYDTAQVEEMRRQVRAVVRQLENASFGGRKFLVDSIPLPVFINKYADSEEVTGSLLSFNNCQIEVVPGQSRLYLPRYRAGSEFEKIAKHVFEFFTRKGFDVREVNGNFGRTAALDDAALHCMVKVLSRE